MKFTHRHAGAGLLAVACSLAACTSGGSDADPTTGPEETEAPTDSTSDGGSTSTAPDDGGTSTEPSDTEPSGEEVTIDFASFGTDDEEIERQLLDNFQASQDRIKIGSVEYLEPTDYWTRMQALAASNDLPCVMWMSSGFVDSWRQDGLLVDLQPYIDADINTDDYYSGVFEITKDPDSGDMYAFPFRFVETVMYYNIDAFEAAGVELPTEEAWTWEQFQDAATKLTVDENGDGTPEQYGAWFYGRYAHIESWVYQNGGRLLNEDRTELAPDAGAVEAINYLQGLITAGVAPMPAEFDGVGNSEVFSNGFAAMFVDGSFNIGPFRDANDFNWGIAPVPRGPSATEDTAYGWPDLLAVTSSCENPDEAWELINYMTGPERTPDLAAPGGIPILKATALDPAMMDSSQLPTNQAFLLDWAEKTGPTSFTPNWGEWRGYTDGAGLEGQLNSAFNGEKSVDDALATASDYANEILARDG